MIEKTSTARTSEELVAYLRLQASWRDLQAVMDAASTELRAALAAQGVPPSGASYTHHYQRPVELFDFDLCLPLAGPIRSCGRIERRSVPALTVVRTLYHGSYAGLAAAWDEFCASVGRQDLETTGGAYERYLVTAEARPDPSQWRTELSLALAP